MDKILILSSGLQDSHTLVTPFIDRLSVYLSKQTDCVDIRNIHNFDERTFFEYDQVIFVFFVAMNSIPSSTLEIFSKLEGKVNKPIIVSSLIVCDEYECEKCDYANMVVKNFVKRENYIIGSSLKVASGLIIMKSLSGPVVTNQIKKFAESIINHESQEYQVTLLSEKTFLKKANQYWIKHIKKYIKQQTKKV